MRTWTRRAAAVVVAVLAWCEWKTWRASQEDLPADGLDPARIEKGEVILVLGCPRPALYRWRVRIAVRSTDPMRARFIFSGGAVRSKLSEAQMMANYAVVTLGVPATNIVLEDQSRTTVQNIENSIPLLVDAPAIKIASNTFHARRARRILRDESPELAARLVRARDYLPVEWGPVHGFMLAHELIRRRVVRHASLSITEACAPAPRCRRPGPP
ncbi:YdcF family protein [Mycolicibacterium sp. XJ870]